MFKNFFSSNEFAVFVLLVAAGSLVLLYMKGRVVESAIGAILLVIAAVLMFLGNRKKDFDGG
jgi:predicted tellurium resistance membrane protein TerC